MERLKERRYIGEFKSFFSFNLKPSPVNAKVNLMLFLTGQLQIHTAPLV
jgi:hypothetical protein